MLTGFEIKQCWVCIQWYKAKPMCKNLILQAIEHLFACFKMSYQSTSHALRGQAHRDDRSVVDKIHVLNGHSRDLSNQDTSESIGYGRVNALHVKLHIKLVFLMYFDTEIVHPFTEVPLVVDIQ